MADKIVKAKYFIEDDFVETVSEVSGREETPWGKNEELKVVGKRVTRVDADDKVTGSATYTFDVNLPGMVIARILRSPWPHADILSIDTRAALRLNGVYHILTYKNVPDIRWFRGMSPLFSQRLRYQGDEVACVAAESEAVAEKALSLIQVKYKTLDAVSSAAEAMTVSAPKIYPEGNIQGNKAYTYKRGDVTGAFEQSDFVVEDVFKTQCVVHNPLEVHCSVAKWEGDELTVWDSTQGVFKARDEIAGALGIPSAKLRVIKKYMGGGFGSKLEAGKYSVMAALLAKAINRPVKILLDRKEMNLATGNRPDSYQNIKAGVMKDGSIQALTQYSFGAIGGYSGSAGCSWPLRTLYQCTNVETEEYSVQTNTGPSRPFRAPGHVQGTFALESMIDILAEKVGLDPIEFRIRNHTKKDQVMNLPYTSKLIIEAYRKGAECIGWKNRNSVPGSSKGSVKRGLGMASQIWWGGGGPPAYATLKLNKDGSAEILAGTQDIGTGTYTFMTQIVSEVLEIPMEKVTATLGDTRSCPYCNVSGGSLTAPSVSPAVRDASEKMKETLLSGGATLMDLSENDVFYRSGAVFSKADETKHMSIQEIIQRLREQVLVTTGARNANPDGYALNTFGAQFADIDVDTDTGRVKVNRIVAAHDIGRVLNRTLLENQFHGGIMQGIGFALLEERVIDRHTHKVLTTNLNDYKLPTIIDVPKIDVIIVSEGDPIISSTGVKGIGEPAIIPTAAAIANAFYNATGVRLKELPMTPDRVLNALVKLRTAGGDV